MLALWHWCWHIIVWTCTCSLVAVPVADRIMEIADSDEYYKCRFIPGWDASPILQGHSK